MQWLIYSTTIISVFIKSLQLIDKISISKNFTEWIMYDVSTRLVDILQSS